MTDADRLLSDPDLLTGRLFFAVPVPGATRAPLEAALPELGRALPAARLAAPAGWHLTLAFLGQVRPEFSSEVVAVGEAAVAGLGPAVLRLEGAGGFPNERRARVLWTGVGGDVEVLGRLAANLAAACRVAGLRSEERELQPHLTLARLPTPGPVPERAIALVAAAAGASPPWEARELCCYRSTLTNRGARYRVVRAFPLAGPATAGPA
jgi:RNA 2',3'-cyclic 3'-phosphodiesterase